jgi:hypothetical protein
MLCEPDFRFSLVLDARKSGLRVKKEVFAKDRFEHSGKIEWRAHKNEEVDEGRGEKEIFRSRDLPTFIVSHSMRGCANGRWTAFYRALWSKAPRY